jgi:hypothetical protein
MEDKKGFWIWSGGMAAAAALSLAGAIIGKTAAGYILFGLGLAGTAALFTLTFLKKDYFKEERLKPLILGLVIGLLLAAGMVLVINGATAQAVSSFAGSAASTRGQGQMMGNRGAMGGSSITGLVTTSTSTGSGTTSKRVKILLGCLLLAGGLGTAVVPLVRFLKKKTDYSGDRWKTLLLGFVLSAMIGAAVPLLITSTASAANPALGSANFPGAMGTMPADFVPGVGAASETATETATPTPEATVSTPEPTATATSLSFSTLVVCLDADVRYGLYIRDSPSDTANAVGAIPAAGCFTLDARAAGHDGWYRMTPGQNGFGGIYIYGDETKVSLWVHAVDIDASQENLDGLTAVNVDAIGTATASATANAAASTTETPAPTATLGY